MNFAKSLLSVLLLISLALSEVHYDFDQNHPDQASHPNHQEDETTLEHLIAGIHSCETCVEHSAQDHQCQSTDELLYLKQSSHSRNLTPSTWLFQHIWTQLLPLSPKPGIKTHPPVQPTRTIATHISSTILLI